MVTTVPRLPNRVLLRIARSLYYVTMFLSICIVADALAKALLHEYFSATLSLGFGIAGFLASQWGRDEYFPGVVPGVILFFTGMRCMVVFSEYAPIVAVVGMAVYMAVGAISAFNVKTKAV